MYTYMHTHAHTAGTIEHTWVVQRPDAAAPVGRLLVPGGDMGREEHFQHVEDHRGKSSLQSRSASSRVQGLRFKVQDSN